jgi:hypothetical protein
MPNLSKDIFQGWDKNANRKFLAKLNYLFANIIEDSRVLNALFMKNPEELSQ